MNFAIQYETNNPDCADKFFLTGAQFTRKQDHNLLTNFNNGNFEVNTYLDYHEDGLCEWKAKFITIKMKSKKDDMTAGHEFLIHHNGFGRYVPAGATTKNNKPVYGTARARKNAEKNRKPSAMIIGKIFDNESLEEKREW